MQIANQVRIIANKLKAEGKEPTTALIKARLAQPAALPAIISALQAWKAAPDLPVEQEQEPVTQANQDSSEQSQLDRIEAKLDKIIHMLEKE